VPPDEGKLTKVSWFFASKKNRRNSDVCLFWFGAPAAALLLAGAAWAGEWRRLDPANTLVIETSKGRVVVEMRPDIAPLAVARVKKLAREGVYDGLLFHRVLDHYVDQTGNPNNRDGGTSRYHNLPPEFRFTLKEAALDVVVRRTADGIEGFLGATPIAASPNPAKPGTWRAWGVYCAGVAGMGREAAPDSANSEIFFMRDASRSLDHDYTVWGRVVQGLDVVRAVAVGEPPAHPDRMIRVQVMADAAVSEQPHVEVIDTRSAAFAEAVGAVRREKGADFSLCDVDVTRRMEK
jgi:peptidylprolyl isomerase